MDVLPVARAGSGFIRARGHTLIELLIATAFAAAVVTAAVSLYREQRQIFVDIGESIAMRDAGTAALQLVGQQIEMAGYVPADWMPGYAWVPPAIFGCSSARPVAIGEGFACMPGVIGSDGIVVRFVDDAVFTWPSSSRQSTDCLGQGLGVPREPAVVANGFFVDRLGGGGAPQLYCVGNGAPRNKQPIVSGVDRLQLRYWMRGAPEAVDASFIATGRWADVVAVDVCVVVRGVKHAWRGRTVTRTGYRDCDGVVTKALDGHARQAFSRRFAVRNHEAGGA